MAQAEQTITTGVWTISCGGFWVRDVNGRIELSPIGDDRDPLNQWRLTSQGGNSYVITNVGSGANAWAEPPEKLLVQAGDAIKCKWLITSAGNGLQHIQWPNDNYYWTAQELAPGPIVLEGLKGLPTQVWKFTWVGDC